MRARFIRHSIPRELASREFVGVICQPFSLITIRIRWLYRAVGTRETRNFAVRLTGVLWPSSSIRPSVLIPSFIHSFVRNFNSVFFSVRRQKLPSFPPRLLDDKLELEVIALVKNVRRLLAVNETRGLIEFIWLVLRPPTDRSLVPRGAKLSRRGKRDRQPEGGNGPGFIRTFEN